jgi:hypothetical protein
MIYQIRLVLEGYETWLIKRYLSSTMPKGSNKSNLVNHLIYFDFMERVI